jgi:F-type H+-transporting ATPase subunit b
VLTAVVTHAGALGEARVVLPSQESGTTASTVKDGPSPIAPELKELAWGAGSFIVFALLMRFFLFPRLKAGMDARYALIRSGHDGAEKARASAQAEVAAYRSQLAELKAEAAQRVDAARQQLETERAAKLAEVNARIATKRAAAADQAAAARAAARDQVAAAVSSVAGRATELAIGAKPDAASVDQVVAEVLGAVAR